ncbi:hypothetical protein [Streptomyces sp. NPDC045470]|uniref:hypothetical protein n=1 Tax=Streptomyces sp. NPDC045470 TaxID=3155469 RepID=UPI0033E6D692
MNDSPSGPDGRTLRYLADQVNGQVPMRLVTELDPLQQAVLATGRALEHLGVLAEPDPRFPQDTDNPGPRIADLAYQANAVRQHSHELWAQRQSEADLLAAQAQERADAVGEVPYIETAELTLNRPGGEPVTVRVSCGAQGTRWSCDDPALSGATGIVDHLEIDNALQTLARVLEPCLRQAESGA